MVLPDSRKVPRAPRYLGAGAQMAHTPPTGLSPSMAGRSRPLRNRYPFKTMPVPQPPWGVPHRFRLFPVRSPLLGESHVLSLPPGTKMFQFPGCPPHTYVFSMRCPPITADGFPHSDTSRSSLDCSSLERFAADRVLHRHSAPRHPPDALCSLLNSRTHDNATSPQIKQTSNHYTQP